MYAFFYSNTLKVTYIRCRFICIFLMSVTEVSHPSQRVDLQSVEFFPLYRYLTRVSSAKHPAFLFLSFSSIFGHAKTVSLAIVY